MQAWEKFFKIQHAQPEDTHELLRKLLEDLEIIKNSSNAIAPVLPTEEPEYSDVPIGNFKIYSSPLFDDEEIISSKKDPHHFSESYLIESLFNQDTFIDSSSKFDFLLKEFSSELAHIDPILPGIKEADFDLEKEIRLIENLLYDNSTLRPPEELNAEMADTIVESLSPSHILVENRDIHIFEEFVSNDSLPIPENELSNFDHHDDPSFSRPPSKPLDVEVVFDFEPNTGVLTAKMMEDISEHHILMPKVLPTQRTLCLNIDPLLLFSSVNEDKVFKLSILSSLLISHRDKTIFDFSESPMMMYGGNILLLDVLFLYFYPP
nr:hypothetical protein [Tanacetum cinerariifolium]GEW09528.1 hypothetical protein [Tanacetum cinerariifolium]